MMVEILDRRSGVRQRIRLRAFPATIGRGYDNDVILADRYADPLHARVEWDGNGGLVLVDQGSANGLRDPHTGQRARVVPLRSGVEVRLGRTTLRFVDPATPVEPAIPDRAGSDEGLSLAGVAAGSSRMVAVVLGTGLLLALNTWLGKTERVRLSGMLGDALVALLLLMIWAGGWAMVNRITQHRFRFLEHLTIPSVVLSGVIVATALEEWLSFLLPRGIAWDTLTAILGLGLAAWGLAAHLARVSTLARPAQWLWSLGIIGALAGIATLARDGDRAEFAGGSSDTPLKPLGARWIPASTPDQFLQRLDGLKQDVDRLSERMAEKDLKEE